MPRLAIIVWLALLAVGCGKSPSERFSQLSKEYIDTTLSFSPSLATGVGLHQYQKQDLDSMLDDVGAQSFDRQKKFYEDFLNRLQALDAKQLSMEDQADMAMLQDQCTLALMDFNELHPQLHNPTIYVETLGNALFSPFVLEYAPKPVRYRRLISRLEKVPLFLDQAALNLISAPGIWTKVAIQENQGNIDLVNQTIRAAMPPELLDEYARAARPALAAMHKFDEYLRNSLSGRDNADWRLGQARYTRRFQAVLEAGTEADTVLANAERELDRVRAGMLDLAMPLHRQMFPAHKDHADLSGDALKNQVIGEVLSKIAERHGTPENYMDDARQDLEEARAFVQQKHLLTLPTRSNLQVIPTPDFMRGAYSVGGFNAAPALEPQLGAFYWITPIPADWPKERIDSKLREYNFYGLKLLTLHEAMPGHYVQMEIANGLEPPTRRVLRSVLGNNPYIEGWAVYATQTMLEEGYLDHSPELALTFAKHQLRVIANTILDVRLQMLNMTDQEAMDLMQTQTFQEKEEATEKLQRAKLSNCQLPVYYVGWQGWLKLRDQYRQTKGQAFSLPAFHDAALREGAVPMPWMDRLLK
ncbi:MAG: DUF885 domain-containing protein [Bryobacteraceae bacterium]